MVSKREMQSPTVPVGNHLKRSSLDSVTITTEAGVHYIQPSREENAVSAQNNTAKGKLRRVRFSSENEVFEITRPTRDEKIDMHMTREDQKLIIREISNAIHRLGREDSKNGANDSDSNQYIEELGIERILQQQQSQRIERVRSAIFIILQRQRQAKLFRKSKIQQSQRIERVRSAIFIILQRQRQAKLFRKSKIYSSPRETTQIISEGWLEKHYRPFSKVSSELARNRGLQDEETAPYLFPRRIVMAR
eukprot:CAMPEP_0197282992 /NCGR_PEP_ID=MMETSP1432-20130617/24705_1 /TAXON_ID=44447 /ORGANISM="Pseudo-nitzschia delicatissima, Strain UNC1205" /LENGTH=248 /DNA_ID=CAMNT_0042749973 /DNA_START=51 /DNA_END=797 /DNA_ORIENTATION=-